MSTTKMPAGHHALGEGSAGARYGHVPGHQYHDVDCLISSRSGTCRCEIVETWGSAQGADEEHGRQRVVSRGPTIDGAASSAMYEALQVGMREEYVRQAVCAAVDDAHESD